MPDISDKDNKPVPPKPDINDTQSVLYPLNYII